MFRPSRRGLPSEYGHQRHRQPPVDHDHRPKLPRSVVARNRAAPCPGFREHFALRHRINGVKPHQNSQQLERGAHVPIGRNWSSNERVFLVMTSPVCNVDLRSISMTRHSSSATGLCRTPLGTTYMPPSRSSTVADSISLRRRPLSTRNISSSFSWLCQASVPWTLATLL